jgi:hypothetical protein
MVDELQDTYDAVHHLAQALAHDELLLSHDDDDDDACDEWRHLAKQAGTIARCWKVVWYAAYIIPPLRRHVERIHSLCVQITTESYRVVYYLQVAHSNARQVQ